MLPQRRVHLFSFYRACQYIRNLYLCVSTYCNEKQKFLKMKILKMKKVVLQEATGFYSSFQQIKERTGQALWGNMGTGKIIMGNMNNIREATPEQIKRTRQTSICTRKYIHRGNRKYRIYACT